MMGEFRWKGAPKCWLQGRGVTARTGTASVSAVWLVEVVIYGCTVVILKRVSRTLEGPKHCSFVLFVLFDLFTLLAVPPRPLGHGGISMRRSP